MIVELDLDEVSLEPVVKLGTEGLPTAVVTQNVTVGIWSSDRPNDPGSRAGLHLVSLRVGDRENPEELSPEEVEYVARVIETAAEKVRRAYSKVGS